MKTLKKAAALVLAAVISNSANAEQQPQQQQPSVSIKVEGGQGVAKQRDIAFLGYPRLHQVYEQAQLNSSEVFWPGVRLVSASKHQAITEKQRELTRQLYQLQAYYRDNNDQHYAQLVGRVAEQVASWPLVGAEPIGRGHVEQGPKNITYQVDISKKSSLTSSYDEARLNLNANPALTESRYQLLVPSIHQHQFPHLQIIGAVWVPFAMNYHADFTARETAKAEKLQQRFESLTLHEKVVQVTAAGDVQTIYIDPYNAHQQQFSAGAKIIALFNPRKLPSEYHNLNEQLTELARYWNPLTPQLQQGRGHFTTVSQYIKDKAEPPTLWLGEAHEREQPSTNDFGSWGLLQMPSGRHADTGEFAFTYYDSEEYRRWALNLQVFPWLEATLRYNDIRTRKYSRFESFSGDQTYKDRGVDFKFRLTEESRWIPETSVGIRDLAGTGFFAGEYVAASKRFGNFDFTAGIGWGYLGKNGNLNNPFCELSDEFCRRPSGFSGRGGSFEADKWFKGNSAWFAGLEYQSPWDPLTIKFEYDSNNYVNEPAAVPVPQDSRWNYGLVYEINDYLHLKASYERGNTFMFGLTLRTNFDSLSQPKLDSPKRAPRPTSVQTIEQLRDPEQMNQLRTAANDEAGISIHEIAYNDDEKSLTLYGSERRYRDREIGLEKLGRVLATEVPDDIETYQFVSISGETKLAQDNIDAQLFKDAIARNRINATTQQAYSRSEVTENPGDNLFNSEFEFAKLPAVTVKPYLEQSFGGPEAFYMYQIGLDARAYYSLSKSTFVSTTVSGRLLDNYDKFNYTTGRETGALPRVRTYVREYVTGSDVYLRNLYIGHQTQISNDLFAFGYVGYQEEMFGGFGGEVLYRELDSNWAVGVDVNYARQRDWKNHFGFRDYDVITGHVTGYWQPSFLPNTRVSVALGRFLAGDHGAHVAVEHKFKSGVIAGAYAAKTNVSADEYGEGSFTKGFYISIPFDLLQLRHSTGRGMIGWSPLTRDGGQLLNRPYSLFGATDKRSPYYVD